MSSIEKNDLFMITCNNVLPSYGEFKKIIDYEIEYHLCQTVPKYQSYPFMHEKYYHNELLTTLINFTLDTLRKNNKSDLFLKFCWFNVCKQDSEFQWHTHPTSNVSAIYFMDGCEDNGTILDYNGTIFQILPKENSLFIFNSTISHTIPTWKNKNRYSIALEFLPNKTINN